MRVHARSRGTPAAETFCEIGNEYLARALGAPALYAAGAAFFAAA